MKYSIITVNYNNCKGLQRTIDSVLEQTYHNREFIVIDGGSTDGSKELLEKYNNKIDYWVSEPDKGIYNGMNKGILRAHGEFVNFMNSGDTFYDKLTLDRISKIMGNEDILVGCDYHEDSVTGKSAITVLPIRVSFATFFVQTFPHQGSFIRKLLFDNSLYDESLEIVADWKFYLDKVAYKGCSVKLVNIPICHREQGGISGTQTQKVLEERQYVLEALLPPGIRRDYESLSKLDCSTMYKLLNLCDTPKVRKMLVYIIKILYRLYSPKSYGIHTQIMK